MRAAGQATRERILAAAQAEFAEHGIAGARINRIAAVANASKDRLYAYFPSKLDLYVAVTEQWSNRTTVETALRADDLPGYIGRLFDHFLGNPEHAKLQAWVELEPAADQRVEEVLGRAVEPKLAELRRGQHAGLITGEFHPAMLLRMLTDLARTTATASAAHRPGSRDNHRKALIRAAERLVSP